MDTLPNEVLYKICKDYINDYKTFLNFGLTSKKFNCTYKSLLKYKKDTLNHIILLVIVKDTCPYSRDFLIELNRYEIPKHIRLIKIIINENNFKKQLKEIAGCPSSLSRYIRGFPTIMLTDFYSWRSNNLSKSFVYGSISREFNETAISWINRRLNFLIENMTHH